MFLQSHHDKPCQHKTDPLGTFSKWMIPMVTEARVTDPVAQAIATHGWKVCPCWLAGCVWGECPDEGDAPTSIPQRPNSDRKQSTKAGKDIKCTGLAEACCQSSKEGLRQGGSCAASPPVPVLLEGTGDNHRLHMVFLMVTWSL